MVLAVHVRLVCGTTRCVRGRGGGFHGRQRGRPHQLALEEDNGASDDLVFQVELELAVLAEGAQEKFGDVVAEERARLRRQPGGQIGVACE